MAAAIVIYCWSLQAAAKLPSAAESAQIGSFEALCFSASVFALRMDVTLPFAALVLLQGV